MRRRTGVLCAGAVLAASLASAGTGYRTDYDYPGQGDDWYGRSGVPDPRRDFAPTRVDTFSSGDDYGRGYEAALDTLGLGPPLERTNSDLFEYVFRFDRVRAGGSGPGCSDADGDGVTDCDGDCDDGDARRFPGNPEICDGVDNDCDGVVPAGELDADGDGVPACAGDCDDGDARRFPGNPEVCDGLDNDCDGQVGSDEIDDDVDGVSECDGDCDDADARRFPGNPEVCDGVDNDCDAALPPDEADGDADGVPLCGGDCDDGDARRFPGNPEVCDGVDNDCDGLLPPGETDGDADGVPPCGGDCDDADPDRFPGNPEVCDDVDNDCDGQLSPEELDDDADGVTECDGDCDDADADSFPGAVELCDGRDNDCDGAVPPTEVDADGDGVLDCLCPPLPDPKGQGYWHRQCLGVPAREGGIDPGRNGRGPQQPSEPGFTEELMPCGDQRLEDLGFYGESTCEGMDANPPSDPCERALKHLTSLVLNVCSGRLADGCVVDAGPQGCSSALVGDLIEEIGELIQIGMCEQAASCAEAVNEGDALID